MSRPSSLVAAFLTTLGATVLSVNLGWAESTTPVAASPHRLVAMVERSPSGTIGVCGACQGDEEYSGVHYGGVVSYLYRGLPWLEFGASTRYARSDYTTRHLAFLGGQARASLGLDSARRAELGLSLSAGLQGLRAKDEYYKEYESRYYLGAAGVLSPDARYWVSPSCALSVAGTFSLGLVADVAPDERAEGAVLSYGGQVGVVAAL